MYDYFDDTHDEAPSRSMVRWMDRPPMHVGPATLSGAVAGAFVLGAAAVLAIMALSGRVTVPDVRSQFGRRFH